VAGVPDAGIAPVEVSRTAVLKLNFSGAMASTALNAMIEKFKYDPVIVDKLIVRLPPTTSSEISGRYVFVKADRKEVQSIEWGEATGAQPNVVLK
jgi:Mrp family chromosome partitioning ATPase